VTIGGPDDRRVVLVCVMLYAAVASLTRPLTSAAAVAVAVPAVAGLVLAGLARPSADRRGNDPAVRRTAALWAVVVALGTAWELAAWLQQPAYNVASHEHPTASMLFDPVTEAGIPRFAAWCCWMYFGYRVIRR
jgi:cobalamin synthase